MKQRPIKELVCVLFGHDWRGHGKRTELDGTILEQWSECGRCKLETHDRSGSLVAYELKYGTKKEVKS